ncbi:MAG: hypothetical protein EZS28_027760 [Streblomastix strix]|uniref:Uncharacterized protein n=1 Tax=Streblomastix strix TaxID=222440 RepID=A0A5J4V2Y1_9EUKA|nr:MAG: hypothetical protein EZS28_027760 [Streblomastix strix]
MIIDSEINSTKFSTPPAQQAPTTRSKSKSSKSKFQKQPIMDINLHQKTEKIQRNLFTQDQIKKKKLPPETIIYQDQLAPTRYDLPQFISSSQPYFNTFSSKPYSNTTFPITTASKHPSSTQRLFDSIQANQGHIPKMKYAYVDLDYSNNGDGDEDDVVIALTEQQTLEGVIRKAMDEDFDAKLESDLGNKIYQYHEKNKGQAQSRRIFISPSQISAQMSDDAGFYKDPMEYLPPDITNIDIIYMIVLLDHHYVLVVADRIQHRFLAVDTVQYDYSLRGRMLRQACQYLHIAWGYHNGYGTEFPWVQLFGEMGRKFPEMWAQPQILDNFLIQQAQVLNKLFSIDRVCCVYVLVALHHLLKEGATYENEIPSIDVCAHLRKGILNRYLQGLDDIMQFQLPSGYHLRADNDIKSMIKD